MSYLRFPTYSRWTPERIERLRYFIWCKDARYGSVAVLADRIGTTASYLSQLAKGHCVPGRRLTERLDDVARRFGVTREVFDTDIPMDLPKPKSPAPDDPPPEPSREPDPWDGYVDGWRSGEK